MSQVVQSILNLEDQQASRALRNLAEAARDYERAEKEAKEQGRQLEAVLAEQRHSAAQVAQVIGRLANENRQLREDAEAAAKGQEKLQSELRRTATAANDLGAEAKEAGAKLKHMEDGAGDADSVLQGLSGAIEHVNPEVAEFTRGMGDAAGGLEALTRVGGIGIGAMGALGAAVGVTALVYRQLSIELETAEARQQRMNELALEASRVSSQVDRVGIRAAVARGDLSEEQGNLQLASLEANALYANQEAEANARLAAANQALAVSERELAQLRERRAQGEQLTVGELQRIDELSSTINQRLVPARDAAQRSVSHLAKAEANLVSDLLDIASSSSEATDASENRTRALEEEARANKALNEEIATTGDLYKLLAQDSTARTQASLGAFTAKSQLAGNIDSIVPLTSDSVDADLFASQQAAVQAETRAYLDALGQQSRAELLSGIGGGLAAGAQGFGAAASSLAGGNPAALLSAAGPYGSAAAAGLQGLQALGALEVRDPETGELIMSASEAVGQKLDEWFAQVTTGLEALPDLLQKDLPEALEKGLPKLVETLIVSLPNIIFGNLDGLRSAIKLALVDLPIAIVAGITQRIREWWEGAKAFFQKLFSGGYIKESVTNVFNTGDAKGNKKKQAARAALAVATLGVSEIVGRGIEKGGVDIPLFHTGGVSDREQVALLEAGEIVTTRGAQGPRAVTEQGISPMGAGGSTVFNLHLHGPVTGPESLEWVVEGVRRHFSGMGGNAAMSNPWSS